MLTWEELNEVLLDVEIAMNNRQVSYMEEDVQLPTLTSNSMLFLNPNYVRKLKPHHQEVANMRKRAKFLRRTKDEMWSTKGRKVGLMSTCEPCENVIN